MTCIKNGRFVTLPVPLSEPDIYAYRAVSKPVPQSKYQNPYNSMSFETPEISVQKYLPLVYLQCGRSLHVGGVRV
jgi:hypothetical protein